jgi:cytochrome c-type biogenesis protein CcmH
VIPESQRQQASKSYWRAGIWLVLAAVLAVALFFGSSSGNHPASTPTAKAAALDAQLRCPSCDDLSVADSSAPTAVAIKQLVLADEQHGVPNSAIVSYLQSRYPGILLRPPASGVEGLVWFAPLAAFVLALCAVGVFFWRRRAVPVATAVDEDDRKLVAEALKAREARDARAGRDPTESVSTRPSPAR